MNNRVALVIPYFGTLPNYFNLWAKSAGYNKEFTFLIYTDSNDEVLCNQFENITIIRTSFMDFANRIRSLFDFSISLDTPYKLCDYKPTYGAALKEDLKEFDFWGYCDIDIILGNLSNFLNDDILDANDRIYNLGHFNLYRNVDRMNNLYKISHEFKDCFSYKYAYQTPFITTYDEIGTKYGYGLSTICQRIGIKNYLSLDFADVLPDTYHFKLAYTEDENVDFFVHNQGELYGICGDKIKEYAYVHLQKRKMLCDKVLGDIYYISPMHFRNNKNDAVMDVSSINDKRTFNKNLRRRKIKSKMNKLKQGALIHLFNKYMCKINVK